MMSVSSGNVSGDEALGPDFQIQLLSYNFAPEHSTSLCRLIAIISIFLCGEVLSQDCPECRDAQDLLGFMSVYHVDETLTDEILSDRTFERFIDLLDPETMYFLESDLDTLRTFKETLITDVKNGRWDFVPLATALYKKRLKMVRGIINEILQTPLTVEHSDTMHFSSGSNSSYASDSTQCRKRWEIYLRYRLLERISSSYEYASMDSILNNFEEFEKEAREYEQSRRDCRFESILDPQGGFSASIHEAFLSAIARAHDPHSSFFTVDEKNSFEGYLSTEIKSYGLYFESDEAGVIRIAELEHGGPAWNTNKLHEGDVVTDILWPDGSSPDLICNSPERIVHLLTNSEHESITLNIRKSDGREEKVKLIREEIEQAENSINSYILKGDKKFGYIAIPSFYTNWDNEQNLGCANDVVKQIIKLKREDIDGLIVDLRYNGGGSIYEAIDLIGIFIDVGPVGMLTYRTGDPFLLKETNRGAIYNGPLTIMVNGMSASASEFVAGTLQDYNRALIVGNKTYGKSTAQSIVPLDTTALHDNPDADLSRGYVKFTGQRLYRVTGHSHQEVGIIPDVTIPDIWDIYSPHETDYKWSLKNPFVEKKVYMTAFDSLPVYKLRNLSDKRISNDTVFTDLVAVRDSLKESDLESDYHVPLDMAQYWRMHLDENRFYDRVFDEYEIKTSAFEVDVNAFDADMISLDEDQKELKNITITNIEIDKQIEEAFYISSDLIQLTQNE